MRTGINFDGTSVGFTITRTRDGRFKRHLVHEKEIRAIPFPRSEPGLETRELINQTRFGE
uniref:Uncharacterized protein n=1 Tax=Arabidopsis thaliana TaxID=3702 RepID=Q0WRE3_ARATH|nr:hypothetical protein [Arabidopsis thaliana]